MDLFKRKDKSPFRHIGMALVPPVAFTAVPDSPPPTPIPSKRKKKKKVAISPIVPAMISANIAARAIALGSAGDEIDRLNVTLESLRRRDSEADFIDEDEMYARISYQDGQQPRNVAPYDSRDVELRDSEDEDSLNPTSSTQVKIVHQADVYAVPDKLRKTKEPQQPKRGRTKKKIKKPVALTKETLVKAEVATRESLFPSARTSMDSPSRIHSDQDVSLRQDELEEKMRLRDEQTREMIMKLMQNSPTEAKLNENPPTHNQHTSLPSPKKTVEIEKCEVPEDHDLIKEIAEMLREQSITGAEGVVLKQQIQEMVDENEILKGTVHRLNVELSRYQTKYGNSPELLEDVNGLPMNGSKPKWLTDVRYLSPLFLSYDEQLTTKDEIIASHEKQFAELGKHMEELLKENEILRIATEDKRAEPYVSQQKWDNLKEQNNLMVEEIQIQMEQLELMERKAREMHLNHIEEVSKLSQRLAMTDADYQQAEKSRIKLKEDLNELTEKFERNQVESSKKVPAQEFAQVIAKCKSEVEDLKEQNLKEMKEVMKRIKEAQQDKSEALLKLTESTANNKQLQGEIEALKVTRKSMQEQLEEVRLSLEEAEKREVECQLHLANMVRVAERASSERATFAAVAEQEQRTSQHALKQTMREKWEMGRMEESLKHYKIELASHKKDLGDRLRDVEDSHSGQLLEYERKMAHLQKMLQKKQEALDDMATNKRQVENELETVWQAASAENRRIMEALHGSRVIT